MNLNKVTITGADETVKPSELIEISKQYPFVEWGILFSKSGQGKKLRYPSLEWINELLEAIDNSDIKVNLSAHICGEYMRELLKGNNILPDLIKKFDRFQFNFKYFDCNVNEAAFVKLLIDDPVFFGSEIIFQLRNDLNDNLFYNLEKVFSKRPEVTISGLYDCSGGTGQVINDNFPLLLSRFNTYFGYAGGINPSNIGEIIRSILEKGKDNQNMKFWIDMESGVRTDNVFAVLSLDAEYLKSLENKKDYFDLNKVNDCLLIAKNYIIL